MAAMKFVGWIQNFAGLPRAMRALRGYPRLAPGRSQGATAMGSGICNDGTAMVAKDEEFFVMLAAQCVAYLRPSELCSLTTGQVIRPLWGSGTRCWALLLAPQEDLKAAKTAEFDESILLDGELSVALGRALAKCTAGKVASTPFRADHRRITLTISTNGLEPQE